MPPDKPPLDKPPLDVTKPLFVSIREGALVPRFTLAGKVSGLIGAARGEGRTYVWHPEAITMIPAAEVAVHRKAYAHALANGDLVRRTAREHQTQQAAAEAASKAAKENREAPASPSGSAPAPVGGDQ